MSKIKLLNNQGDIVTIEHSDTLSKQGNLVVNIKDVTKQVDTIADLKALDGSHKLVYVTGYYTKGDGAFGSHVFEWDATSTEVDNGGTVIKLDGVTTGRYKLKYDGAVNVKWFGVTPTDSVIDKTTKIQTAIDSLSKGKILVEANLNGPIANLGFYDYYDTSLNIPLSNLSNTENIELILEDRGTTTIIQNGHNVNGIVNEQTFKGSGYHQGVLVDTDNRLPSGTKGSGQVESNRATFGFRNGSVSKWQISNDIDALKHDGLTIYKNNPSLQMMHFHESGKIRIGRRASIQDFSEPSYGLSVCESMSIDSDSDKNLIINMRLLETGKLEGATPTIDGGSTTGNEASVIASHYSRLEATSGVYYEGNLTGISQVISPTTGNIRYGNRGFVDITEPRDAHVFNGDTSINSTGNPSLYFRSIPNWVSDSANTPTNSCNFLYVGSSGEFRFYSSDGSEAIDILANGNMRVWKGISGGANVTSLRPTGVVDGTMFFDQTLNKPIWYNNGNWYDANGTVV